MSSFFAWTMNPADTVALPLLAEFEVAVVLYENSNILSIKGAIWK